MSVLFKAQLVGYSIPNLGAISLLTDGIGFFLAGWGYGGEG